MKNIGSLHYIEPLNVDSFHQTISKKKSQLSTPSPVLSDERLSGSGWQIYVFQDYNICSKAQMLSLATNISIVLFEVTGSLPSFPDCICQTLVWISTVCLKSYFPVPLVFQKRGWFSLQLQRAHKCVSLRQPSYFRMQHKYLTPPSHFTTVYQKDTYPRVEIQYNHYLLLLHQEHSQVKLAPPSPANWCVEVKNMVSAFICTKVPTVWPLAPFYFISSAVQMPRQ